MEPVEVLRPGLEVIFHALRLEEKLRITPEGRDGVRPGHEPADHLIFTTALGRRIVSVYLEHNRVVRNDRQLVLEVVLVVISPSIGIIRLNFDLERPVRLWLCVSILIVHGEVLDGRGTDEISCSGNMFSKGLSSALIHWLTYDSRPSVLKVVERLLAVKREHGVPVGGSHAISVELDTVAWNSFHFVRHSHSLFSNAHDAVLSSSEDASVRRGWMGNKLDLGVDSDWTKHLLPMNWHGVTDGVIFKIEI